MGDEYTNLFHIDDNNDDGDDDDGGNDWCLFVHNRESLDYILVHFFFLLVRGNSIREKQVFKNNKTSIPLKFKYHQMNNLGYLMFYNC